MPRKTLSVVEFDDTIKSETVPDEIKSEETQPESNLVWGAEAIGRVINRKPEQVRRLHQLGFFGNAVWKAGHRTLVGSLPRLRNLGSF